MESHSHACMHRVVSEASDANLEQLVLRSLKGLGLPGLPPLDVTALGVMLCYALDAVQRTTSRACLAVHPGNVLLTSPASTSGPFASVLPGAANELLSVRLAGVFLTACLPACVRRSFRTPRRKAGAAAGSERYAAKEELAGRGCAHSDVFSVGATLLFAATGVHPCRQDSLEALALKLTAGANCGLRRLRTRTAQHSTGGSTGGAVTESFGSREWQGCCCLGRGTAGWAGGGAVEPN